MSSFLVLREWDNRNRWRDEQVCPGYKELWRLGPDGPEFSQNARSIAFSQRSSSTHLIEDETSNDSDIIHNLIYYEDGHEEPDSLSVDTIYAGIQLSNKSEKHFLKIDTNSKRSLKFQKESCISGYRDVQKQLTNRSSPQKLTTYFMVPRNKSTEIVSSSDESDFELIHHRNVSALDCDE
ncbi:uncharacterized protein TNCV_4806431 [Trichonephila clavipes]|nr:uncharacterized protein TNCV_4806431 [Trichonephila clavipes]